MMEFLKNEIKKIKELDPSETYYIYFRLNQALTLFAMMLFFVSQIFMLVVSQSLGEWPALGGILGGVFLLQIASFVLAQYALGKLQEGKIQGLYIGIGMSILNLFISPLGTVLGIFGLYSFLKRPFREKIEDFSPEWFKKLGQKIGESF